MTQTQDLQMHRNVKVTADDDVPSEVRRVVGERVEQFIQRAGTGEHIQVTIARRKNPNEIYDVRVGRGGAEFQHDFERGDLDSERFDIWLGQKGMHRDDPDCWCGHAKDEHSQADCSRCDG